MTIDEAIQGMVGCSDYEAVLIGEQLYWHKDGYLTALMQLGFGHDQAEKGIIRFCEAEVAKVEHGEEVSFPNYREDLVALIARHCEDGMKNAA